MLAARAGRDAEGTFAPGHAFFQCAGRYDQMVDLQRDGQGQVWVGGQSVTCIEGVVTL